MQLLPSIDLIGSALAGCVLYYLFLRFFPHPPSGIPGRIIWAPFDAVRAQHNRETEALTETLQAKTHELEEIVSRYQILTDNLAASIAVRDRSGQVSFCSPYTEVLTGYSLQEIYDFSGDFFAGIVHPDDKQLWERALLISNAGEAFQFRYRFFHKSGILMWAETRTVPILDEDSEVVSLLSVTLDVTGLIRYQRQVEERNRDLQDFTYMVSHDLKSPIFTIKGMTDVLRDDMKDSLCPENEEVIEHISRAADRLEQLVASVLEYSRISGTELTSEQLSLSGILDGLLRDLQPRLNSIGGTVEILGAFDDVLGENTRVYQVFSNLLGNAIKYRDPARPLKIELGTARADSKTCTIFVRDNGLGIPEEKWSDIFRPFSRVHVGHAEGSGVGLATVKRLAEKLGGGVEVESEVSKGSTFYVTLRRAKESEHDIAG